MGIAGFCIKHRVTTILAFVIISIFGIVYASNLQMALLPDMEFPAAYVYSYFNGATPGDMEELVTRPLEAAVMSVPGVDSIQSSSSDSVTTVQITYDKGTDVDIAATKLRERFDALSLPEGCSDPVILNINISELMPVAMIALIGDDLVELQALAEDIVAPALERISGVASVTVAGGSEQRIAVEVDQDRARGYGLSNSYIAQILTAENLLFPGGSVENGPQTLTVTTDAKLQSVDDVANVILPLQTGGSVRLREIADVTLETADADTIAKVDGTRAVVLQVSKRSNANEAATASAVADKMEELAASNASVRYALPYMADEYINLAVRSAMENIILGVVLAAVVVFLFLRRFGATLAIAVSMPVCILAVFMLMYICKLTMNMMSLGGVAMGVGMIVDNSIVVLENIHRYSAEGHDRKTSCVEGTKEVMLSLTASTLTTVAVFLPLGLSGGMAGMLFKDFCLTIAFLILASLVISVTLVPLLCYFLLDEERAKKLRLKNAGKVTVASKIQRVYQAILRFFVRLPGVGVLVSAALVAVFVLACLSTNIVLLPDMDMSMIQVDVTMPVGSSVDDIARTSENIVDTILENAPEVDSIYYVAQEGSSTVGVTTVDRDKRDRTVQQIAADLREPLSDIAGCELTISASDMTAMISSEDLSVAVTGTDYSILAAIAEDLTNKIAALPDTADVKSSASEQTPHVVVTVNRETASQYGLTAAAIGSAVRSELVGSTATEVTINNKEIDVIVRGDGSSAGNLDALRSMSVTTAYGGTVPLSSVASVDVVLAPQTINRVDQSRQITITGTTLSGNSLAAAADIQAIIDEYNMPEGYSARVGGNSEEIEENFGDLTLALLIAAGLVYFVLASQFESFLMPIIIMLILPVAFSGALFALPITGRDLSMISMVALIMLAGTVVNASIILVDYIKKRRKSGEDRETAIVNACPLRVRPVLMTTLTTILALVPMAIGLGDTNEMLTDMGITMISGMAISTIVTLFFTPVYYCLIDNIGRKKREQRYAEEAAKSGTVI